MSRRTDPIDAMLEEALLTLDDLCRVGAVTPQWVHERIVAGLIGPQDCPPSASPEPASWRFDLAALQRVRRMARLERDFDAVPELAALVADLETEIAALRRELERLRRR